LRGDECGRAQGAFRVPRRRAGGLPPRHRRAGHWRDEVRRRPAGAGNAPRARNAGRARGRGSSPSTSGAWRRSRGIAPVVRGDFLAGRRRPGGTRPSAAGRRAERGGPVARGRSENRGSLVLLNALSGTAPASEPPSMAVGSGGRCACMPTSGNSEVSAPRQSPAHDELRASQAPSASLLFGAAERRGFARQ
jgi:hypothetical protein